MKRMLSPGIFLCLLCVVPWHAKCQSSTKPVPQASSSAAQQAIALYHQKMGRHAPLYSGVEYIGYNKQSEGHQFLGNGEWSRATVVYEGVAYPNVPLLYDVANEMVVIGYAEEGDPIQKIVLVPEHTQSFTYGARHFLHLNDSTGQLPPGFYEMLYQGDVQLLAKRRKSVTDRPNELAFSENDQYFLLHEGKYHQVSSKASVLKVFKEYKQELAAFIREQGILFNQNRETAIARVAAQYSILHQAK